MKTNPDTHPWFVRRYYATSAYGLYGWSNTTSTHATEEEARTAYAAPLTARETEAVLFRWRSAHEPRRSGQRVYDQVERRKRAKKVAKAVDAAIKSE